MEPCAKVYVIRVLSDNFSYIIVDEKTKKAACVDPTEPEKVLEEIKKLDIELELVLCTHHHNDHSGGNEYIRNLKKNVKVVGSAYEHTPGVNEKVYHNQIIKLGELTIKIIHAPCHTKGHILYYIYKIDENGKEDQNYLPILFTGDTIFIAGCGKFFEGNAKDMFKNIENIKNMKKETLIYCGHEYTLNNLRFALTIEEDNEYIINKFKVIKEIIKNKKHSVPSTIEEEKLINPFFRTKFYFNKFNSNDEIEILNKLRQLKNNF